ncbi:MAG TPA: hypothetical protein VNE21_09360, partial [Mycobacteriales bacterium]|nr:hypothetical protein [Mycobacteriales bacterium]
MTPPVRALVSGVRARYRDVTVWCATAAMASVVVAVCVGPLAHGRVATGRPLPWAAFLVVFAFAQAFPLWFEYHRQARMFCIDQLPTVIALYYLAPRTLVLATIGATLFNGSVVRRWTPLKLLFNVSIQGLQTAVAVLVFRALLPTHDLLGARAWPAAFSAILASDLLSTLAVAGVITLYNRNQTVSEIKQALPLSAAVAVVSTSLALVAVPSLYSVPATAWALVLFVTLGLVGFQGFNRLAARHRALDRLYALTRNLGPVSASDDLVPTLDELRGLVQADHLELLLGVPGRAVQVTQVSEDGGHAQQERPDDGLLAALG